MTEVFDIRQLDENRWQAKYHGNYGIYVIKLTLDKSGKAHDFSCNCPSDYYPCKHIGYVQSAIVEYVKKQGAKQQSHDELRAFVVKKAAYSGELTKDIMLEFAGKIKTNKEENSENTNPYSSIIGNALSDIVVNPDEYDNYYDYSDGYYVDLDILGEWLRKAGDFVSQAKYDEAVLICKACIEEYVQWLDEQDHCDGNPEDFISDDYMADFFDLLEKMTDSGKIDEKSLYEYCKTEIEEKQYENTQIFDKFNDLMAKLTVAVNPDEFIAMQNALLKKVEDKSSHEARKILERIIYAYRACNQPEKAEKLIEDNPQIESFCRRTAEKRIAEKKYSEAKILINKFTADNNRYDANPWKELLLTIARKENDKINIRKIAFEFLEKRFDNEHFEIYKSTFRPEEWIQAFEELCNFYDKRGQSWYYSHYNANITELLCTENLPERLMDYIETHLSVKILENYYRFFSEQYPARTLTLFRKSIDEYAEKNIGREHYEYIVKLLQMMQKIHGGDAEVAEMTSQFRAKYKNRRAMREILNKNEI